MPDSDGGRADAARELAALIGTWRESFDRVEADAIEARDLVDQALTGAESSDPYDNARTALDECRHRGGQALLFIDALVERISSLRADWEAATRYEKETLAARLDDLRRHIEREPASGAREWLADLFDALDAREMDAVKHLSSIEADWPNTLRAGAERVRGKLSLWAAEGHAAGLALMNEIADGDLYGWQDVLNPELKSRAHRLAAWVALRRLKDPRRAERHLTRAIEIYPYQGRMHAERAAYYLFEGQLERAVTDAQRAIELASDDAAGFIELGIWAELSGEYNAADGLYRQALELLPMFEVSRLHTRASLMDPPGRLLVAAAEVLLDAKRADEAVALAERALLTDLRGNEPHPQALAHRVRSQALATLEGDERRIEAARAAVEAGKLFVWNGQLEVAIDQFERALALDGDTGDSDIGWLLADAILATSMPLGSRQPDYAKLARARDHWERWCTKVKAPRGDSSWAYLTRAVIADLSTQHPEADRLTGVWEALLYVEKALVHDDVDAQRWGFAAQYLRYVKLQELAFEAAERGYKLGSGDRQVLAERLPLLASHGRIAEAEQVAERLVTMYGNDPWVSAARAWLAVHSDREGRFEEAASLLELPLAEGNDPSWYYDMQALCNIELGDIPAARADYRELLRTAPPIDGTTKCRLAIAAVAVREGHHASQWLEQARRDPTSRPVTCLGAEAFAAMAKRDYEKARDALTRATDQAASRVELEDLVWEAGARIALLDGDPSAAAQVVADVAEGTVRKRTRWLEDNRPTPDSELAAALEQHADAESAVPGLIEVALQAVRGRRALQRGRIAEAIESYERILGSAFEPETTIALVQALRVHSDQSALRGDVDEVRRTQDRLSAIGEVTVTESALAVAAALESRGDYAAARDALEECLDMVTGEDRDELHQRAGRLALMLYDDVAAENHFRTALDGATARGDADRIGQLEIRLALVALRRDELPNVPMHLIAAVRAWRDAGALEPATAIREELRGLMEAADDSNWSELAAAALEMVELTISGDREATTDRPAELDALERELNPDARRMGARRSTR